MALDRPKVVQRPQVAFSDDLRFAFDYFLHRGSAAQLKMSTFPDITWTLFRYAIAQSHEEPMLYYALAALGSLWQAIVRVVHSTLAQSLDARKSDLAIQFYCNSLAQSRKRMDETIRGDGEVEPILVTSMLLFTFEIVIGNTIGAFRHLRLCRAVINAHGQSCDGAAPGSALAGVVQASRMIAKGEHSNMTPQARVKEGVSHGVDEEIGFLIVRTRVDPNVAFSTVDEASLYLEHLLDASRQLEIEILRAADAHLRKEMPQWCYLSPASQQCAKHCISRILPLEIHVQRRLEALTKGHEAWLIAFAALMRSGQLQTRHTLWLHVRFFGSHFLLLTCRETAEKRTDRFTTDFVRIVSYVENLLPYRGTDQLPGIGPHLPDKDYRAVVVDWGVLPTLYMICVKCRTTAIRKKAIRLLAMAYRQEGVHKSAMLAQLAGAIRRLEEQRAQILSSPMLKAIDLGAAQVPEEARFLDIVTQSTNNDEGVLEVVCGRLCCSGTPCIELESFTVQLVSHASEEPGVMMPAMQRNTIIPLPPR